MLRIKQKYVGVYTLRAQAVGSDNEEATVDSPAVEILFGDNVIDAGTPTADGTDLVHEVAYDLLPPGVYLARFTGDIGSEPQEWRVWFEIVAADGSGAQASPGGRYLSLDDLDSFATIDSNKALSMIADAEASACIAAPCLQTLMDPVDGETEAEKATRVLKVAAVRAILRAAVLRWHERGYGSVSQTSIGGISQSYSPAGSILWNRDIDQLREICSTAESGKAFSVDTVSSAILHAEVCGIYFGGPCSCGADIAGVPIYEDDI